MPHAAHPGTCRPLSLTPACGYEAQPRGPGCEARSPLGHAEDSITGRTRHSQSLKNVSSPRARAEQAPGRPVCAVTRADAGSPRQVRARAAPVGRPAPAAQGVAPAVCSVCPGPGLRDLLPPPRLCLLRRAGRTGWASLAGTCCVAVCCVPAPRLRPRVPTQSPAPAPRPPARNQERTSF